MISLDCSPPAAISQKLSHKPSSAAPQPVRSSSVGRPLTAPPAVTTPAPVPKPAVPAPRRSPAVNPAPAVRSTPEAAPAKQVTTPVSHSPAVGARSKPVTGGRTISAGTGMAGAPAPAGHMSSTPLLAHSHDQIPSGLAATLEHIVGQVHAIY